MGRSSVAQDFNPGRGRGPWTYQDASHALPQHIEQLVAGEDLRQLGGVRLDDARHHLTFLLDQGGDLLFQCPLGDQLEDLHRSALPEPVDAVGGLVLLRRVPPAIVVDHGRSAYEVDPGAPGLEAAEEDAAVRILVEAVDDRATIDAGAGELDVPDAELFEVARHQLDHPQELGEDDHLVAALQALAEDLAVKLP